MTDPRRIQHDQKVQRDKKHHGETPTQNTEQVPQPGKKPHLAPDDVSDADKGGSTEL